MHFDIFFSSRGNKLPFHPETSGLPSFPSQQGWILPGGWLGQGVHSVIMEVIKVNRSEDKPLLTNTQYPLSRATLATSISDFEMVPELASKVSK